MSKEKYYYVIKEGGILGFEYTAIFCISKLMLKKMAEYVGYDADNAEVFFFDSDLFLKDRRPLSYNQHVEMQLKLFIKDTGLKVDAKSLMDYYDNYLRWKKRSK